jgi:hypothetical protein
MIDVPAPIICNPYIPNVVEFYYKHSSYYAEICLRCKHSFFDELIRFTLCKNGVTPFESSWPNGGTCYKYEPWPSLVHTVKRK